MGAAILDLVGVCATRARGRARVVRIGWLLSSIIGVTACGSGSVGEPAPAATPEIVPSSLTMGVGSALRLSVKNLPTEAPFWSSSDSNHARVDQTGLVRAVRLGTAVISASVPGVPGQTAAAPLTVVFDGPACCGRISSLSLSTLRDARTGEPMFADAVHDSVTIVALATEWRLYSELQLHISGQRDTLIRTPVPADFFEGALQIGWNSNARTGGVRAFPNGAYRIDLRLVNGPDTTRSPNTVAVTVANP
jgi:hypothetical protein